MKKLLTNLFLILLVFSLTACGEKNNKKNDVLGLWKVEFIEYEGSKFTVEEWNNMEEDDLSDFYIILKDGGKAYIYDDDYGYLVDWLKSDDSIMIGDEKCSIIDDQIILDYYGDKIYLQKASDNQEIPNTLEDEENNINKESDWKEFLEDYEAWIDDYIELLNKYNDNPEDVSIMSDYMDMVSEMTEWTSKAEDIKIELKDSDELLEYSNELLRIAKKLSEVEY